MSLKVLYVCTYYKPAYIYGGPVKSVSSLCEALIHLEARVTVFTTNANGPQRLDVPLNRPVEMEGVKVWYYGLRAHGFSSFYAPAMGKAIHTRIGEFDLAVVEPIWSYPLWPTSDACTRLGIPYIIPMRGQLFPWALSQKRLKKAAYLKLARRRYVDRAAALHCTSSAEAQAIQRLGFRPPTFIVPNAVDVARFAAPRARGALRSRLGIPEHASVLLFLGRLAQIKRPDIALHAMAAARSRGQNVHLIIAGPDEDTLIPGLRKQAQHLGGAEALHYVGLLDKSEVQQALVDSDLLVMPSEVQENFGRAALEAMAAGLPVLVSEGIPVGEWAVAAGAGRVVPCRRDAFGRAALDLLADPERLQLMGQAGRELARQQFDVISVARQMLSQFKAILRTGRPLPEQETRPLVRQPSDRAQKASPRTP